MNDLRTAAQQALEALEYAQQDRECPSTTRQAITALRAALAQQAEPVQEEPRRTGLPHCERSCEAQAFQIEIRRLTALLKEKNA